MDKLTNSSCCLYMTPRISLGRNHLVVVHTRLYTRPFEAEMSFFVVLEVLGDLCMGGDDTLEMGDQLLAVDFGEDVGVAAVATSGSFAQNAVDWGQQLAQHFEPPLSLAATLSFASPRIER
eukprot:679038-Amphidinium_carterae.1